MKLMTSAVAMMLFAVSAPATARQPRVLEALDGLDPVLLVQGKEIAGKADLKVQRGRFEYLFSSPETKATFEQSPEKYEIQLNGMCARMGKAAGGNPADFLVHDGKIYIFGSDDCHKKFAAAPAKYLPTPPPPMPTSAAAQKKAHDLLAQLVQAMGGAQRIDGVKTYTETASQVVKRGDAEMPLTTKLTWRFPDATRVDRTMTRNNAQTTSATLVTAEGAWFLGQAGRAYPMEDFGRKSVEQDLGRHPLALLRSRDAKSFEAVALGTATIEGTTVEQVRVRRGPLDVTLGIDKVGQLHSVTFIDRNNEGEIGTFTLVYSDYRNVDGLKLPFSVHALYNGQPDSSLTQTVTSIVVNGSVDPSTFAKPSSGAQ